MPASAPSPPTTLITASHTPTALVPPFHEGDWVGPGPARRNRARRPTERCWSQLSHGSVRETRCAGEASVAVGFRGYYELAGGPDLGRRGPGNTSRRRRRSRSEVRDQTVRQGGFDGSVSAKLAGPTPQIATTAGSFWLRITPSKCGVPATRCTTLPAGAHTHEPGSKSAPRLTHQAPETTTQNRSVG
jgi:hypothetical protein